MIHSKFTPISISTQMPIPTKKLLSKLLSRGSTTTATATKAPTPRLRCSNRLPSQYKLLVIHESQKALTEYLHATKCIPFFFAEQIATNSLFSLSHLLRKIRFSVPTFPERIRSVLRYHPLNEFEFFFESIGIDHRQLARYLPPDKLFLSDGGGAVLDSAVALSRFGFPWRSLGKLYAAEPSVFSGPAEELAARLRRLGDRCSFRSLTLVGACLAFPRLLAPGGADSEEALFEDLKRVSAGFEDRTSVEGNVDRWYEACRKVLVFYDLGCEGGTIGELMCRGKRFFEECPSPALKDKANYFLKFGVGGAKVGSLLLQNPELLAHDLESPPISVSGLLRHFGMSSKELRYLRAKYPHVFGRNRMANLPNAMRALDLHEWAFRAIESRGSGLLLTYALDPHCRDAEDKKFRVALEKTLASRQQSYAISKLEFLKGLGFGENALTLNVLRVLQATCSGSRERFDYLLSVGIKYSDICLMMKMAPGILCMSSQIVEKKVNYLCQEMGSSLKYLYCFPRFLLFDLEKRIKPRHLFYLWLRDTGLYTKNYSVQSIVDESQKRFIARLFKIHPAAPKLYLECFL